MILTKVTPGIGLAVVRVPAGVALAARSHSWRPRRHYGGLVPVSPGPLAAVVRDVGGQCRFDAAVALRDPGPAAARGSGRLCSAWGHGEVGRPLCRSPPCWRCRRSGSTRWHAGRGLSALAQPGRSGHLAGAPSHLDCRTSTPHRIPMPKPLRLILLSCLMLFVELALIRWTGSNVVYLSYFSNFVLLGSFLGIGIGFLRARARVESLPVCARRSDVPRRPSSCSSRSEIDRAATTSSTSATPAATGLPPWLMLPVIFLAVAGVHGHDRRGGRARSSSSSSRSRRTGSTSPAASWESSAFSLLSPSSGRRPWCGASWPRCSSWSCCGPIGGRSSSSPWLDCSSDPRTRVCSSRRGRWSPYYKITTVTRPTIRRHHASSMSTASPTRR